MLLKIGILISMFLTGFNVYSVFAYACFMCICLKTAIWLFLTFLAQGLFFFGENSLGTLESSKE